jgi:hypothetical protein
MAVILKRRGFLDVAKDSAGDSTLGANLNGA